MIVPIWLEKLLTRKELCYKELENFFTQSVSKKFFKNKEKKKQRKQKENNIIKPILYQNLKKNTTIIIQPKNLWTYETLCLQ